MSDLIWGIGIGMAISFVIYKMFFEYVKCDSCKKFIKTADVGVVINRGWLCPECHMKRIISDNECEKKEG